MAAGIFASRQVMEQSTGADGPQSGETEATFAKGRQAYIVASGIGVVNVTIVNGSDKEEDAIECHFYHGVGDRICLLWSDDGLQFDSKESVKVKVSYSRSTYSYTTIFKFSLMTGDFVDLLSSSRSILMMNNLETVHLLVDFKDFTNDFSKEGAKIQYVALLPYSTSIDLAHSLTMYLRKGEVRATPTTSAVQVSSKLGIGFVKTLTRTDPDFCVDRSCKVAIRLETVNVDFVDFRIMFKHKASVVPLEEGQEYIEDMVENDEVTYEITPDTLTSSSNWMFLLVPIDGNPDMAINIGSKPASINDYRWKTNEDKPEEIYITQEEIKSLNLENKKFYITLNTTSTTQFAFRAFATNSQVSHLRPNTPISGEAKVGEIVNYIYEAFTSYPETLTMFADLSAKSGNPDMYIKDCSNVTKEEDCKITQAEIDSWNNTGTTPYRLAAKSSMVGNNDNIYFRFNCLPDSPDQDQYKNFKFEGDEAQLFTTKNCLFAVAVVGKQTTTHQVSKYTLELKGSKFHHVGELKLPLLINEGPQNKMYIKYTIGDIDPKHNYLNFKFTITSGDFDVHFSRLTPFPDESNADKSEHISTAVGQRKAEFDHYVTIKADPSRLSGVHYLTIAVSLAH